MGRVSNDTKALIKDVKDKVDDLAAQLFAEVVLLQERGVKGLSTKLSNLANRLQDIANK